VFCQKVAGGLYLHNWLHANNCKETSHPTDTKVTGYNCTCIDDFSMPFAEDAAPVSEEIANEQIEFLSSYTFLIPLASASFHLQRGPPIFS
jgi:hypothetical protein